MMILLGQHGQRQDFPRGLEYIRLASQSCDQNAPQGAYVSHLPLVPTILFFLSPFRCASEGDAYTRYRFTACFVPENFLK